MPGDAAKVFLYAGTLSTSEIVAKQADGGTFTLGGIDIPLPSWYAILLIPSFLIYMLTMFGETNRVPFDLPEGEGELVAGYHTEYSSSLKFAMFQLAEYVNVFTVSGVAITLFLGGWRAPGPSRCGTARTSAGCRCSGSSPSSCCCSASSCGSAPRCRASATTS